MVKNFLIQLEKQLKEYGVVLSFTGAFTQGIIEEMGDALKAYLKDNKNTKGKVYKIFSIFIELTQNVKNYVKTLDSEAEREKISASGVVIIGESDQEYFISSGNLIRNEDVAPLKKRIEEILDSDDKEIKKLYKKRLRQDMKRDAKGAGLGLIDISRKTERDFQCEFIERGSEYNFFTITVFV